jgi:hypothetical protein
MGRRLLAAAGLCSSLAALSVTAGLWVTWTAPDVVPVQLGRARAPAPVADPGRPLPGSATGPTTPATIPAPSPPARIVIPGLAVNATVVPEPLQANGGLVIPPPSQVGWYDAGPAPGQPGSTLLAGHIDYGGVPGAFVSLSSLAVGAAVNVVTVSGQTVHYTVSRLVEVPKASLSSTGVLTDEGSSVLVMVSCGGAFLPDEAAYADNVVVTAVPAGPAISVGGS